MYVCMAIGMNVTSLHGVLCDKYGPQRNCHNLSIKDDCSQNWYFTITTLLNMKLREKKTCLENIVSRLDMNKMQIVQYID